MPNKIEIIESYVDKEFEDNVLKLILPKRGRGMNRNQIIRYGSSIPYDNFIVSSKIPPFFRDLENKIAFDSVTINEYVAGQRIEWHKDKKGGGDVIYVISLLSDAYLKFRLVDEEVQYFVPRYSLTVFSEELRTTWLHSLVAIERRVSVVLRNSLFP